MTQIEEVKAEIEWLLNLFPKPNGKILPIDQNAYNLLDDLKIFIESLPVKHQSDNLEEAASRYAKEEYSHKNPATLPDRCKGCYVPLMYAFKDGANWQKEQIMKSAIDALVDEDTENVGKKTLLLIGEQRNALNARLSNYEYGETVKLVIIKKDEQ